MSRGVMSHGVMSLRSHYEEYLSILQDGWCPLLYAVKGGHVTVVKCLLEKEELTERGSVRSCIQVTNKVCAPARAYTRPGHLFPDSL